MQPVDIANDQVALTLPAQSVTWLSISDACLSPGSSLDGAGGHGLAVTGGDDVTWVTAALLALALLVRRCARARA